MSFNMLVGKFYCKLHFAQRKTSVKCKRRDPQKETTGVRAAEGSRTSSPDGSATRSATGSVRSQPPGGYFQHLSNQSSRELCGGTPQTSWLDPSMVAELPEDSEQAHATEGPSLSDGHQTTVLWSHDSRTKPGIGDALNEEPSALSRECAASEVPALLKRNYRWRRRIQATFPLLLVKTFERRTTATDESEHQQDPAEKEDCDFEEIVLPVSENPVGSHFPLHQEALSEQTNPPADTPEPCSAPSSSHEDSLTVPLGHRGQPASEYLETEKTGKKKLSLSLSEKEKLLDWDVGVPGKSHTEDAAGREEGSRDPQNNQNPKDELPVAPPPMPPPPQSTLQLVANALKRSFRVSGTVAPGAVTRRNRAPRTRPLSEGSFSFNSLFGVFGLQQQATPSAMTPAGDGSSEVGGRTSTSASASTSPHSGPSGSTPGASLPKLLEEVSLSSRPPGAPRDDLAALPPRKLNFFSSLRVKRCEGVERDRADTQEKDIWSILTDLRKKVSNPQQHESSSSSSEEDRDTAKQKQGSSSLRQRRKQEKVVEQRARREQLKRLHRAQVIQRQLEEVEEKQRVLEERGVTLEKLLRGETADGSMDESHLLQTWFRLVLEKNKLVRYESELMIFAQELELEDMQSQLQQKLRHRMAINDSRKSVQELAEEQEIFSEMMRVVEKRDALVGLLEEQRLKERAEDQDLESVVLTKGYQLHWA
ncbi:hypothetical protein AAFF_G00383160 [Aldrovandia affinis]|uniref:BMERB domain-containing protein n=1 Tax=Aldrovandia affinis TaxID=143900 RepID=A0AAD7X1T1_9TELE|nr:hypothetical protein AAFF_G00383160 [Aldrovandia affinis]